MTHAVPSVGNKAQAGIPCVTADDDEAGGNQDQSVVDHHRLPRPADDVFDIQ
jgi:hypothetical protein